MEWVVRMSKNKRVRREVTVAEFQRIPKRWRDSVVIQSAPLPTALPATLYEDYIVTVFKSEAWEIPTYRGMHILDLKTDVSASRVMGKYETYEEAQALLFTALRFKKAKAV